MSDPEVIIREATAADAETVFSLIQAIAEHHGQLHLVRTNPAKLLAAGFEGDSKFSALLAELDGVTVGFVSYAINYSIWLGCDYMHIDDVYVDADTRGKGVGEALMYAAKQRCGELGLSRMKWEVQTDNLGARRFYDRLGARYYEKGVFAWDWTS